MRHLLLLLLVSYCLVLPLQAQTSHSTEEMEKWFMSDTLTPPSQSSDSQLTFILPPTDKPTLHSINHITIKPESLQSGWVALVQCYQHLDPVPEMEVTYQYKALRKLTISQSQNIEQAWVKSQSVQLKNVGKNARLCVSADVRIFYKNKDGSYQLVNGPFHRQFLDSFFPYHLTMKITYPSTQLAFVASKPKAQFGFKVEQSKNTVLIDGYFTGKLFTEISFTLRP